MNKKTKLLYFVNTDWFFISHRLPIALAALKKGYEVHIVVNEATKINELKKYGILVHFLKLNRKNWNPIEFLNCLLKFIFLIKKINPDLIHCLTIKPIIIGTLSSIILIKPKVVISITGMGSIFSNNKKIDKIKQLFILGIYSFIFLKKNLKVIFQNNDDQLLIINKTTLKRDKSLIIRGSGVNFKNYPYKYLKDKKPKVLFASRLLYSKGIKEFIEASSFVKECEFLVAGNIDPGNPQSITKKDLNLFIKNYPIKYLGFKKNIVNTITSSSIIVLPSYYREGLPKILIEAAACGRAIITTDNVGCRDAVINDKTGILIPIKNTQKLVQAIKYLLKDKKYLTKMGERGRKFAKENFDISIIVDKHLKIYEELILK
tara:strand:- start:7 stop:1131 length:1125 start_codon:yes stop_codon:yes gene_type:complete